LRAEILHEPGWNYFLPEFTHLSPILQSYVTFLATHTAWTHKHSNVFAKTTAILASQSEARDPFYSLGGHWLHHFVPFYSNHRTMAISSLTLAVAAASPVPLPRKLNPTIPDMMLDPALPNLLLDSENLDKLEISFPGQARNLLSWP
jgi:hypothetical protein